MVKVHNTTQHLINTSAGTSLPPGVVVDLSDEEMNNDGLKLLMNSGDIKTGEPDSTQSTTTTTSGGVATTSGGTATVSSGTKTA